VIDLETVRAETPAVQNLVHFNNAGTSLMAAPVFSALLDYLQREQEIGGYETAVERKADSDNFYTQAAKLIHCDPDEIAFCESATRAWQAFFYGISFKPGDKIITTQLDYGSNFVGYIQQQQRHDVQVVVIETDDSGDINLDALELAVDDTTKLISIGHIPTANGVINDAARVGEIANSAGIPYLLDACQSAGQIEVNAKEIGCTALSVTGRKYLRGPRGTGFLYVNKDFANSMQPPWLDQHGVKLIHRQRYELCAGAQRFENFEINFASRIALGKALEYANAIGMREIGERIVALGTYCRDKLVSIPGVTVQDTGVVRGGIVTFSHDDKSPAEIRDVMHRHGINVWISTGPGSLVDFQARGLKVLVRASLHYFNTESEIDQMIGVLKVL
jgi:selenocysteine lyase/cysteine desulfurase